MRDVGERHLAEPERVERAAGTDVGDDVAEAPQVHRVLRQAAGSEDAHGDRERLDPADPVGDELLVHVRERRTVGHLVNRDDARGELAQPSRREPADEVLGEHGQALLGLVVAGESGAQESQRLVGAVDVGDDVGADFVLEQGVDALTPAR